MSVAIEVACKAHAPIGHTKLVSGSLLIAVEGKGVRVCLLHTEMFYYHFLPTNTAIQSHFYWCG